MDGEDGVAELTSWLLRLAGEGVGEGGRSRAGLVMQV